MALNCVETRLGQRDPVLSSTSSHTVQVEMVECIQPSSLHVFRIADSDWNYDGLSPVSLKFQYSHRWRGVNHLESAAAHLQNQKELDFSGGLQQNHVCVEPH